MESAKLICLSNRQTNILHQWISFLFIRNNRNFIGLYNWVYNKYLLFVGGYEITWISSMMIAWFEGQLGLKPSETKTGFAKKSHENGCSTLLKRTNLKVVDVH